MISIDKDRQSVVAHQREPGRRGTMESLGINFTKKENRKRNRKLQIEKRQRTATESRHLLQSLAVLATSTSSNANEEEDLFVGPTSGYMTPSTSKRGRQEVLTTNLVATLDRNKVSDRAVVMIIGETVCSQGQEIHPIVLN